MNEVLLPAKLEKGDNIGIVAPSRPVYAVKEKVEKGAEILLQMGYGVKFSQNFNKQSYYSAGSTHERTDDLNQMFANPDIGMIMTATGGISSNQLLPYLDFELIKKNPKPFVGYSDITTLLLTIYQKTGLVTFHGPDLADFSGLDQKSRDFLFALVGGNLLPGSSLGKIKVIQEGKAVGKLIGGNLYLIGSLLGTEYFPDFDNAILFWEETGESPAKIHQELMHLKLAGVFDNLAGIIIGYLSDCTDKKYEEENRPIADIMIEVLGNKDVPVIKVDSFGHDLTSFYTFPIGLNAQIDTRENSFSIK